MRHSGSAVGVYVIVCAILLMCLVSSLGALPQPMRAAKMADEWLAKPVDDRTFKTYLDFFTYDRRVPFELKVLDTSEREGIRKEHLSFQSTPGVRVFANLHQPIGSQPRTMPALVLLHGASIGGKDNAPTVLLSETLTRAGYTVLAIDQQDLG